MCHYKDGIGQEIVYIEKDWKERHWICFEFMCLFCGTHYWYGRMRML